VKNTKKYFQHDLGTTCGSEQVGKELILWCLCEKTDTHRNVELLHHLARIESSSLIATATHTYWRNPSQGPYENDGPAAKTSIGSENQLCRRTEA